MGGDHRGGKRHRHGDGGHRGGRGGGFKPPPLSGADRELNEMRDAIIHCDGSPEMTRNLAGLLSNDLPSLTEPATRFLLECVEELPVKTPVYVALLGLLNKTASKFVEEFVNSLLERLELRLQSPNQDDQIRAKLLTRYITMLPSVHVLKPSSAIDVLDALLCAASDAADIAATRVSAKFTWQPRSDFLVKCALASTPWCGQSLASSTEPGSADAFDNLFRSVEEYLQKRSRSGPDPSSMTFASAVASADDDRTVVADDWLEEIFGRVNETRRAGRENPEAWTTASVPPLLSVFEEFSPESMTQETSNVHTPPPMKVPGVSIDAGAATALATFPVRPRLRILSQKMTEGLWEAGDWGPLERFVAEEYIADTLWAFEPGFRRGTVIPAAEQLGTLPLPGDHPERCQFLVAETLFGEMLALPQSKHSVVFYHVVIQDLCAQIPTFPKMMAKVVGQMFSQIGRMDVEARERLGDWMAHHLSCFDLAWPWRSWEHIVELPDGHPQLTFCKSVVRKLLRSCFQKRVADSLPETLKTTLMPDYVVLGSSNGGIMGLNGTYLELMKQTGTFEKDGTEVDVFTSLGEMLKSKTPSSEVTKWLQESGALQKLGPATCASLLTTVALKHGQKCITHHDVLLKRYKQSLEGFLMGDSNEQAGCSIVAAATSVWNATHPRMAVAAVSRLRALSIVGPAHVAKWVETVAFVGDNLCSDSCDSVRWGSANAFEIVTDTVEVCFANWQKMESVKLEIAKKLATCERDVLNLESAAEDANQRDALSQRDAFLQQAQQARDACLILGLEVADADGPSQNAKKIAQKAASSIGKALCFGILKSGASDSKSLTEAAVKLRSVAASGKEAGREAKSETAEFRALSLTVAALRRFRAVGGSVLEGAVVDAMRETKYPHGDVTQVLGEAVCGPGGLGTADVMME